MTHTPSSWKPYKIILHAYSGPILAKKKVHMLAYVRFYPGNFAKGRQKLPVTGTAAGPGTDGYYPTRNYFCQSFTLLCCCTTSSSVGIMIWFLSCKVVSFRNTWQPSHVRRFCRLGHLVLSESCIILLLIHGYPFVAVTVICFQVVDACRSPRASGISAASLTRGRGGKGSSRT